MAITTRAGKGSALTHAELDANFTTLGLADGDTVANLDVSKMIINATESGSEPRLQAGFGEYDSIRFMREGQTGATSKTASLFVTEYTDAGHTVGQGTGYWTRIKTTDKESHGGAVVTVFESVADSNNWTAALEFKPVKSTSGSEDFSTTVFTVSQDKVEIDNTDAIELNSIPLTGLKLTPTNYADLPNNPDYTTNGMVAFLADDGAGNPQYYPIFSVNGVWKYFSDNSTVAAS